MGSWTLESVQLLERGAQLASLTDYAGEARGGDGRLVLVAGEAGVGKSALVEQLQRDLPEAAWYWGAARAGPHRPAPARTGPHRRGAAGLACCHAGYLARVLL